MNLETLANIGNCLNFVPNVNVEQAIYRVMPVERLLQLINDKRNILVNPSKWDDPFENFFLKSKFSYNGMSVGVDQLESEIFGQCWTLNEQETDALWRIYSPNKDGVRLKSTLSNVITPLINQNQVDYYNKVYIGKVEYVHEGELENTMRNAIIDSAKFIFNNGQMIINSLFIKREAFEHENEVRVIYRGKPNLVGGIHGYNINPHEFIQELLFDPRMDQNLYKRCSDHLAGKLTNCPIAQSTLYRIPDFNINLTD